MPLQRDGLTRRDVLAGAASVAVSVSAAGERKPNVVIILADDLGWMDTDTYGSRFYRTPDITRLARRGMLFRNAYAANPLCSPTRASIMTGKYPARLHTTSFFGGNRRGKLLPPQYRQSLPPEEISLAKAFGQAGYRTWFVHISNADTAQARICGRPQAALRLLPGSRWQVRHLERRTERQQGAGNRGVKPSDESGDLANLVGVHVSRHQARCGNQQRWVSKRSRTIW